MNNFKSLLNKIINRNYDFCCLCFQSKTSSDINIHMNFEDELVMDLNSENELEMHQILLSLLGEDALNNLSAFESICRQCSRKAMNAFKFITSCQQNCQYLSDIVEHLSNCLDDTPDDICDFKTLFINLNSDLSTSNQFLDNINTVKNTTEALIKLQSITGVKSIKKEVQNDKDKLSPKKLRNKYKKLNIPTNEMLYDKNDTVLKCKGCLKIFSGVTYLRSHYIRNHAPKNFECPDCPKRFGSQSLLESHQEQNHVNLMCPDCGKTFNNRLTLKRHEEGHTIRFVCQDCGRVYKNKNTFKKHIENDICKASTRKSPADAKFTCDYCQKKYTQKMTLRVHIQYEHGNYKYLECEWCKKKFWCKSRLNAHIVKHTKEKNFPCSICNGKFVTKESLLYHTRIHTGERPYKCPHCDNRFLSASRRAMHVKNQHMDPTVECDICNCKFKSNQYLLKHKKSHYSSGTPPQPVMIKQMDKNPHDTDKHIQQNPGLYKISIDSMKPDNSTANEELEEVYLEVSDEDSAYVVLTQKGV